MLKIKIEQEATDIVEMAGNLKYIGNLILDGYVNGLNPDWKMEGEEEKDDSEWPEGSDEKRSQEDKMDDNS